MNIFDWIDRELNPVACNSEEFFYNEMESQSYFSLPILYQPFDPQVSGHWSDRGSIFDFLFATGGEGKKLLDFGPGDGWPSLLVAPYAGEVTGVDGSKKRVEVCTQNADRLGIKNARFMLVEPGSPLPFPDETFDGVMAASSIEQTPDPQATLRELFRVLRPGGRLRVHYEALEAYRNGGEQEADLEKAGEQACTLTIYDRHVDEEYARMYRLSLGIPVERADQIFARPVGQPLWNGITIPALQGLRKMISRPRVCRLTHPSGQTLGRWMEEVGFSEVRPTHWGGWFAYQLFQQLDAADRPGDMQAIDRLLRPLVKIVVDLPAPWKLPGGQSPVITAVK